MITFTMRLFFLTVLSFSVYANNIETNVAQAKYFQMKFPYIVDKGKQTTFYVSISKPLYSNICNHKLSKAIIIKISDFGEASDSNIFCITGISGKYDVSLFSVEDDQSETRKAALLIFKYYKNNKALYYRLRLTPWYFVTEASVAR